MASRACSPKLVISHRILDMSYTHVHRTYLIRVTTSQARCQEGTIRWAAREDTRANARGSACGNASQSGSSVILFVLGLSFRVEGQPLTFFNVGGLMPFMGYVCTSNIVSTWIEDWRKVEDFVLNGHFMLGTCLTLNLKYRAEAMIS